jgi:hypothetical protein
MKRMPYVALLCFPFLGQAQTAQVQVAGSNYPVIFADTNLSATVRQRIASDLTVVFSPASSFQDLKDRDGGEGIFKPDLRHAWFLTDEKCEGVFIVDQNNEKSVRLNEVASSNYLHAFAFVDARSNTVKKLREFKATVRNTDWDVQPIKAVKALCYMKDPNGDSISDDDYREFIRWAKGKELPEFSVLWFSFEKRPELDNKEVLVHGNLLLFHNGKWGFGNLPVPGM